MNLLFIALFTTLTVGCGTNPWREKPTDASYDALLSEYNYPFEVKTKAFEVQKQLVHMSFMDLNALNATAPVIVLLHGKNFGGYAFERLAKDLHDKGYRVIIPDQVGFGKSSKPALFQYSFQALGLLTQQLLESQGVTRYILLGHSMGGMLATRMALMYPDKVTKLILVNPIGLEDWKTLTPYKSIDEHFADELKTTPDSIKKYQQENYYAGEWKPEYEKLIEAATGWTRHPDYPLVAWNSALTNDMLFTQPVVYEFKNIKVPTSLIIGQNDKTAPGRAWAPEDNKDKMGLYPQLGKLAKKSIPKARLYELKGLGHVPFVENFERFMKEGLEPALKN